MIIDASAFIAIVQNEPACDACLDVLLASPETFMSAGMALETCIVLDSRSPAMGRRFDVLRKELGIAVVPVTATQFDIGRQAYREFGRGSGSKARLNFGDCMSYALAIERDEPLLFVGDDFTHTDVRQALRD